jgi:hypothetical protein
MYFRARDILDAWRAIVPEHWSEGVEENSSRVAILHNDCHYITYHLVTLGYMFAEKLPPPVSDSCTFVDLIPLVRRIGEQCFHFQLVCFPTFKPLVALLSVFYRISFQSTKRFIQFL